MSDSYSILYSPKATEDLREIYSYIAFTLMVPDVAEGQVNRIRKTIRSLDSMPLRNPAVDWEPWKSAGMRKVAVDHFVVFYTIEESISTVTVIRIVYGKRDIANLSVTEIE